VSEIRLTDTEILAEQLRTRAGQLDAEAARMLGSKQIEMRDRDGRLRNRDWLGFLAAEYRMLARALDMADHDAAFGGPELRAAEKFERDNPVQA
jgi:hypothetical protein